MLSDDKSKTFLFSQILQTRNRPYIPQGFKLKCLLSVTAKARPVRQNLWTLLILSAQSWIHLPVSLFVQGTSYSNAPSFVYHRLDISLYSSSWGNKQIPWHWFQRLHEFRQCKGWKENKRVRRRKTYAKNGMYLVGADTTHK